MNDDTLRRNGELLVCGRCNRPYELGDRFCRKCGAPLNNLPVARENYQPVVWRSPVPAVARGVAVIAVGTLAEIAIRRIVRMVFRPSSLLPALRRDSTEVMQRPADDGAEPDAVIESEAFTVRRVRVRRGRGS
jgi:predicted amidophosphoribosyltransferase